MGEGLGDGGEVRGWGRVRGLGGLEDGGLRGWGHEGEWKGLGEGEERIGEGTGGEERERELSGRGGVREER